MDPETLETEQALDEVFENIVLIDALTSRTTINARRADIA